LGSVLAQGPVSRLTVNNPITHPAYIIAINPMHKLPNTSIYQQHLQGLNLESLVNGQLYLSSHWSLK